MPDAPQAPPPDADVDSEADAPPTREEVRALAAQLKAAVDRHLAAVEARAGENDPAVQDAYSALHEAAEAYDDALFEVYEEVTPFTFAEVPEMTGEEEGERETEEAARLGVFLRRDYDVADRTALLAAGRGAYADTWPEDSPADAEADVDLPGRAVYQLVNAYGVDGLDGRAEDAGLDPRGGTLWVVQLDAADDTLVDEPFAAADEERLVYRLDEVYED
jgi:hypothetical protein